MSPTMKTTFLLLVTVMLAADALGQHGNVIGRDERKFGISVKAGPAIPQGEFADLFSTGFTGFVEVPYNIAKGFSVYLGVGLSRFRADNDKLANELKQEGQTLTTNVDAPYWVLPVVLGLNVSYRYANIWPYFTFSGGAYIQRLETSGSFTTNGTVTSLEPKTQTWTQSAYAVGLGAFIPLGDEGWAIDLNAKFNSVLDDEGIVIVTPPSGDSETTRAIRYVSIMAGLSYTFR
jgi:opacity protein-like surface antigen